MSKVVSPDDTDTLVRDTKIAIGLGQELIQWWADHANDLKTFDLRLPSQNLVDAKGFFDVMTSDSAPLSVMGCLQTARFTRKESSSADVVSLEAFLKTEYASHARWSHPNGKPAGFGYEALLYQQNGTGEIGRFENGTAAPGLDFSQVGTVNDWHLLRVDIYDFLRATPLKILAGPLSKYLKEAAYVVLHESFAAPVGEPPAGTIAECLFGYSFLPCACESSPFGFGPGHFKSALKQFRFSLLESGDLEIRLSFLVAPRSQKVLDLWGFDPVYSLAHLLDALTLGFLGIKPRAHAAADKYFLTVHGEVHHNFLNGMEDFWTGHHWMTEASITHPGDSSGTTD